MPSVCIGIHVHAEPHWLEATLASLRANTTEVVDLLLLPDGPDEVTSAALQGLTDLHQLGTAAPCGSAACFNRLATASQAEVLVLLESGSLVAPLWLEHLLAALAADPHHGLTGPSTNHAWNEQCIDRHSGVTSVPHHEAHTPAAIAQIALGVERHFGTSWRTLQPLHSLADFCYVVRREVVQAIGAADEAYGLGPCWEMDYNIRAARAGFWGVWACAAYVHRVPFTARRAREEARYFETNKQRYQEKFCALRLRGERTAYEPHCRGEECEHFAPAALIPLRLPLPPGALPQPQPPAAKRLEVIPLVSCIMATYNRRDFVLQSIRYFQRQDYPARELIILDDGTDDLGDQIPEDSHIRYLRMAPRLSIGTKRNRGCELARGSIIAQWDDDDWYAPGRLSAQVAPILAGEADISGLKADVFFELTRWQFWTCTSDLHHRLFIQDVHGGTLVFSRRCWEQLARYPDYSLAEDAGFLYQAVQRGARLCRLVNASLFIYLRHADNSWSFNCGEYLDPQGWQRVAEPPLLPEDRALYAVHSPAAPTLSPSRPSSPGVAEPPLVSCIMPTADRRAFVPQAIRYFLRQDYRNRELIVLDDGSDAVTDMIPADPRIRYIRLEAKRSLGAKHNLACDLARGEVIAHWDDDDWMAEWRLSYQVQELLRQPPMTLCGLARLLFYEPRTNRAWEYIYPPTERERTWMGGGTLCYRKQFWEQHRFPEMNEGWDTVFVWGLTDTNVLPLSNHTFYVGTVHPHNSSPKRTDSLGWHAFPVQEIHRLLREDWSFYERWPQGL
jgi:glycosyltransferase involved in cell wall biosynthesis